MSHAEGEPCPITSELLPARALEGLRVGISVSDCTDLSRLGLTQGHFRLAVREVARAVLVGGGTLAYGGHLIPGGFTMFLIDELGQYARAGMFKGSGEPSAAPLLVCLAQQEHRKVSLAELKATDRELGIYGELHCIDLQGLRVSDRRAGRGEAGEPYPIDKGVLSQGLTALRRYMTAHTSARVLIGGKREGYTGAMPGVLEEALMALEARQPLYIAGGFGGITLDMAASIDPRCAALCADGWQAQLDAATVAGMAELARIVGGAGFTRFDNGLGPDENLQLAMTHRPAEIASLVALGLGRWAGKRRPHVPT